jgi:hypothetical protein
MIFQVGKDENNYIKTSFFKGKRMNDIKYLACWFRQKMN